MLAFDQIQSHAIRRDIEGLRAIAVLSVILYHFDIPPFSGGFVGVDIFFVISGYLISRQIKSAIDDGTFSIIGFYERRARRILPALYACLTATFIAGYFILYPPEMVGLSQSVFATTAFFANFHFWKAYQNYFAPTSELAPLLHTWSLAVEEQFYFFAPAAFVLCARFKPVILTSAIGFAILLSFGLSEWMVQMAPSLVFYFTPARAWELLLGTLIAVEPRIAENFRFKSMAIWLGAACLIAPIFLYFPGIRFPAAYALLPAIGSTLIIAFGKQDARHPIILCLSVRPFTVAGQLSYSLYLWHWPILVYGKLLFGGILPFTLKPLLLAGVGIVATLSFLLIEQPIRARKILGQSTHLIASIGVASLVLVMLSQSNVWRGGTTFKSVSAPLTFESADDIFDFACFLLGDTEVPVWNENACRLSNGAGETIMLWGDSTAAHYGPGLKTIAPKNNSTIYLYAMSGCIPVFAYKSIGRPYCQRFNAEMPKIAKRLGVKKIVISGRWDTAFRSHIYISQIVATISALERDGFQVEILASTPLFKRDLRAALWDGIARGGSADEGFAEVDHQYNDWLVKGLAPRHVLDPLQHLCGNGPCPYRLNGTFLYIDGVHLSRFGSEFVVRSYFPF